MIKDIFNNIERCLVDYFDHLGLGFTLEDRWHE